MLMAYSLRSDSNPSADPEAALPSTRAASGRDLPMAAARLAAGTGDATFYRAKIATARFYADQILPQAAACATTVMAGSSGIMDRDNDLF